MRYYGSLLLVLSVFLLSSCSQDTADDYVNRAKLAAKKEDFSTSIIELKNAVTKYPNNAQVRYLLGTYYQEAGDVPASTKELYRALELGYNSSDVIPGLLVMLRLQELSEEIIELADSQDTEDPIIKDALGVYKGLALFRLEKKIKAVQHLTSVVESAERSKYKSLGEAYLQWHKNEPQLAMKAVDKAIDADGDMIEALTVKAQFLIGQDKYNEAISILNQLYKYPVRSNLIDILLSNTYMQVEDYDNAEKHINYLVKKFPNIPYAHQLKSIFEFEKNNYELAKIHSEKAIQGGERTPVNLLIAGISNFQLEGYEQAYEYLLPLKHSLEKGHPALKLLIAAQIKLGNVDSSTLEGSSLGNDDFQLTAAASYELLKSGNAMPAKKAIDNMDIDNFDDTNSLTQLGILKLGINDVSGVDALEKAISIDPNNTNAQLALISAYIESKKFDKAEETALSIVNEEPSSIENRVMLTSVYQILGKEEKTLQAFKELLELDNDNNIALLYFAKKDIESGKHDLAKDKLLKILSSDPFNKKGLMHYYQIAQNTNYLEDSATRIRNAYKNNADQIDYQIMQAKVFLDTKKPARVINVLKPELANAQTPDSFWIMLIDSYATTKDLDAAERTIRDWISINPNKPSAYAKAANFFESHNKLREALNIVDKASKQFNNSEYFTLLDVHFSLSLKLVDRASKVFNKLSKQVKEAPPGVSLEGRILLAENKPRQALAKLKGSYEKRASKRTVGAIIAAYTALGDYSGLTSFLEKHVSIYPNDIKPRYVLVDLYTRSESPKVTRHLEFLHNIAPNNPVISNNLAWQYQKEGELDRALELAKDISTRYPNTVEFLDTLGLILFKKGDFAESEKVFKDAYAKKSTPKIGLNYVQLLINNGKSLEASEVLKAITSQEISDQSILNQIKALKARLGE